MLSLPPHSVSQNPSNGRAPHRAEKSLALVAMPWSRRDQPSTAMGALSAYVRRERPEYCVHVFSEFLRCADALGGPFYDVLAEAGLAHRELLYQAVYYPEKRGSAREAFVTWMQSERRMDGVEFRDGPGWDGNWADCFDWVLARLSNRTQELVRKLSEYDVVGFTTSFAQLFSSLVVARALKDIAPQTCVVLGGASVVARIGCSLLREYEYVDYLVQGEGEKPLVAILDDPQHCARLADLPGILCRASLDQHTNGATASQIENVDDLPIPEFEEYAALAEEMGIAWVAPIEGSRGCWWDRTRRTGRATDICHFCSLSNKWSGYRKKSNTRVIEEMLALSDHYHTLRFIFTDNVVRNHGVADLAQAIRAERRDFLFYLDVRASLSPHELLLLWEAGLNEVTIGIEGLSTSYLRRLGKGTTTIQNLQAMKTCHELGIANFSLIITDFPGSTVAEVEEMRRNILDYAIGFAPLRSVPFVLQVGSTVEVCSRDFGVKNIRNFQAYRAGMPDEVYNRLVLSDLSYDTDVPGADWQPVREAMGKWHDLHTSRGPEGEPIISYQDGGSFLLICDERHGDHREGIFDGLDRKVYLYCLQIRSLQEMTDRFPEAARTDIERICEHFVMIKLMFQEDHKFLSLATALRPKQAADRIRAALSGGI